MGGKEYCTDAEQNRRGGSGRENSWRRRATGTRVSARRLFRIPARSRSRPARWPGDGLRPFRRSELGTSRRSRQARRFERQRQPRQARDGGAGVAARGLAQGGSKADEHRVSRMCERYSDEVGERRPASRESRRVLRGESGEGAVDELEIRWVSLRSTHPTKIQLNDRRVGGGVLCRYPPISIALSGMTALSFRRGKLSTQFGSRWEFFLHAQ